MGDRANVFIKDANVYLYTHWGRHDLAIKVRDALARKKRWDDSFYLARIVFCEMVKKDIDGETGYGISAMVGDGENSIITLDPDTKMITVNDEKPMPFEKFIALTDDQARAWHLGTEDDS